MRRRAGILFHRSAKRIISGDVDIGSFGWSLPGFWRDAIGVFVRVAQADRIDVQDRESPAHGINTRFCYLSGEMTDKFNFPGIN